MPRQIRRLSGAIARDQRKFDRMDGRISKNTRKAHRECDIRKKKKKKPIPKDWPKHFVGAM